MQALPGVERSESTASDTDCRTRCRLSQARDFHDRPAIEIAAAMVSVTDSLPMSGDEMDGAALEANNHSHRVIADGAGTGDILHTPPVLSRRWIVGRGDGHLNMDPPVVRGLPGDAGLCNKGGGRVVGGGGQNGAVASGRVLRVVAQARDGG